MSIVTCVCLDGKTLRPEDYQERPANGSGCPGQASVPPLPQLGGKPRMSSTMAKKSPLFGVDSRQNRMPSRSGLTINSPVPLITGAEQRQASASGKATPSADAEYELPPGAAWRARESPTAVAAMRSRLAASMTRVERNNNIVLEYRKKEIVRLKTADP
ncbi:inverse autotransporter beta domain-containing protein [Salmonella enterica subsp. enterica]|nr:inverse autotransporter beta domain-containing protein [Salmonella enterica subsp. enterica]